MAAPESKSATEEIKVQQASSGNSTDPDETTRLLSKPNDEVYEFPQSKPVICATGVFYFLCILTGQYVKFSGIEWKDLKLATKIILALIIFFVLIALAVNFSLNIGAVLFDIYAVSFCEFSKYCGYIYSFKHFEMTNISNISQPHNLFLTPPKLNQFDDWKKAMLTLATVSGALSYIFMACVLYGRYTCLSKYVHLETDPLSLLIKHCNCCEPKYRRNFLKPDPNELVINPFMDDKYVVGDEFKTAPAPPASDGVDGGESGDGGKTETQYISSSLTPKQSIYFQSIFWFNVCVFAGSVGMLTWILIRRLDSFNATLEGIDLAGIIAQFVSQFSAFISCFIFSKVAYAVSNRCLDFSKCIFPWADKEKNSNEWNTLKRKLGFPENEEVDHLTILTRIDQKYTQLLKNSLSPFAFWFTIHWVLYTLTAFMSIAYVADQILMELYGTESYDKKCHLEQDLDCRLSLAYSMLFALLHCILFLYPCFRAASVTKARKDMIKSVSRADWRNISPTEKLAFVTYLKDQNASFKISVLCARLTFGFELASLSIIIGVFGVVLKLSF